MTASGGPAWYEIRVAGVMDSRWAAWFDGLQVSGHSEETVIFGLLTDQPALHGLLAKVRDLGLILIAVRRLDPRSGEEAGLAVNDVDLLRRVVHVRRQVRRLGG